MNTFRFILFVYVWCQKQGITSLCLVFFFVTLIKAYLILNIICSFLSVKVDSCQEYQQENKNDS